MSDKPQLAIFKNFIRDSVKYPDMSDSNTYAKFAEVYLPLLDVDTLVQLFTEFPQFLAFYIPPPIVLIRVLTRTYYTTGTLGFINSNNTDDSKSVSVKSIITDSHIGEGNRRKILLEKLLDSKPDYVEYLDLSKMGSEKAVHLIICCKMNLDGTNNTVSQYISEIFDWSKFSAKDLTDLIINDGTRLTLPRIDIIKESGEQYSRLIKWVLLNGLVFEFKQLDEIDTNLLTADVCVLYEMLTWK